MFLWHPNGRDRIEMTTWRLAPGFHEVWIPEEDEDDEGEAVEMGADAVGTAWVENEDGPFEDVIGDITRKATRTVMHRVRHTAPHGAKKVDKP